MNSKLIFAAILLLNSLSICFSATAPVTLSIAAQRNYGYTLGDEIHLRILIKTTRGFRPETAGIAANKRINSWLLLKKAEWSEAPDDFDYYWDLTYQLFKNVNQSTRLSIPPLPLTFKNRLKNITLNSPAWSFSYHPLIAAQTPGRQRLVEPAIAPITIDASEKYPLLVLLIVGIALLMAYIAWIYDKLPGLEHFSGAFGPACKSLHKLQREAETETNIRLALQHFHHAINNLAGKTVFADQLHDFFRNHPGFSALQPDTEELFAVSSRYLFSLQKHGNTPLSLQQIYLLCQQYRKIERAGRWT